MHRIKIVLLVGMSFLFQPFIKGQSKQNEKFLQKVGVLDSLYSNTLKEYREIYVQLPAGYDPNEKVKYPVVFVLDGEVLLPTVTNVQTYYSGGFTPEMVIIGIANNTKRMRDLTTSKVSEMYGVAFEQENGEAAIFSKFIETELIPYVEYNYPVTNFRTLIGHSYGGLFTIYTLINNSHLFSNYIAIDPSLDWDSQELLKQAKEKLSKHNYKGKSLFMSLGSQLHTQNPKVTINNVMKDTSDFTLFARSNITFSNMVKQSSNMELAFQWKYYPKDLHGTIAFPSIKDGLIFDFEWYQMEYIDKFNSPETSKEELSAIVNNRAKKLKSYFGYPVPPYPQEILNVLGYMNLDMGKLEKSKMFFEFAITYYSNSANVYDSMADYFERNNDYKSALNFVVKAFEISGDDNHRQRIKYLEEKSSKPNTYKK